MDKSIERIIRRVLEETRAKGRDHLTQTEEAVRAVREARPDLTASDGGFLKILERGDGEHRR